MLNPCIKCGKERMDGRSWKEKNGTSVITHTATVCPDADCQKLVDKDIEDRKAKSDLLIKKKLDAKQAREKEFTAESAA